MRRALSIVILFMLATITACGVPPGVDDRLPLDGNQAFEIDRGNDKGILLIHGMTATPWEVRPLGEFIASRNITVVAPLIAGHGTSAAELNKVSWEDWYASANDSLAYLKSRVHRVYVAGVSTGSDLAVLLAKDNDLDGLILIAPPIELQDSSAKFARVAYPFLPYVASPSVGAEKGHYYEYKSVHAVAELNTLIGKVKTALPKVTEPTLILQSVNDKTVKPSSATFVFDHIGSKQKELRLYGNATHVLVAEQDAPDVIFRYVGEFLAEN